MSNNCTLFARSERSICHICSIKLAKLPLEASIDQTAITNITAKLINDTNTTKLYTSLAFITLAPLAK